MRLIAYDKVVETVRVLCVESAHRLPDDVIEALARAEQSETNDRARSIISLILQNAETAAREMYPLCQDTGVTVVFVEQGNRVMVEPPSDGRDGGLIEAINEGVEAAYREEFLRKSIVSGPLGMRDNTGTNTPAIVHHSWVPGDRLKLGVMLKGAGCENRSRCKMLAPAAGRVGVEDFVVETVLSAGADACPPLVVGVGVGGNFELSCLLAKKALLRRLDSVNPDPYYASMEKSLLERINDLGVGPQGMGGDTTALAVLIEIFPCHIASLPVAVNIECHSHRHRTAVI